MKNEGTTKPARTKSNDPRSKNRRHYKSNYKAKEQLYFNFVLVNIIKYSLIGYDCPLLT